MVRFAVCDDERKMADYISDKLREYYPDECEIRNYTDGESLLGDSRRISFDAFFLDIVMPGLNGMEIAGRIRGKNPYVKIIFVTKREDLAYMGYQYQAFRFVRKSRLESELCEAAESLKEYFDTLSEYLILKTPTGEITKSVKSIEYFEVKGHSLTVVSDEHEYAVCGTMREYCSRLQNKGFILIHKSYLVNFRYISSIERNSVRLSSDKVLPMSRNRAEEVRNKLRDFLVHVGK